jgi:hypothetical protein
MSQVSFGRPGPDAVIVVIYVPERGKCFTSVTTLQDVAAYETATNFIAPRASNCGLGPRVDLLYE